MPSPFKQPPIKQAVKEQQFANMAAEAVAASEPLTEEEKGKVIAASSSIEGEREVASNNKPVVTTQTSDQINLDDLDETTLLKYPIIAKYLNDSAMVSIKPKDSSKVFRWVYYNNGLTEGNKDKVSSTNVGRYIHWGFEFASVSDIQGGEDALIEGIIDDGGKIINYDTVLMKIDKIRLMGHYKQNLLKSISDMDSSLGKAIKTAEGDIVQSGAYRKAMASHPQAKIEFFSPGG